MDHVAECVFSEPGSCWRMVLDGSGAGRPTHCQEPVVVEGRTRLAGRHGKLLKGGSCEGHAEGLEGPVKAE